MTKFDYEHNGAEYGANRELLGVRPSRGRAFASGYLVVRLPDLREVALCETREAATELIEEMRPFHSCDFAVRHI